MKVACAQRDVAFGDPGSNTQVALADLRLAKEQGVDLVVFPECFLTGYCASSVEEAEAISIPCHCDRDFDVTLADVSLLSLQAACIDLGLHCVVGFAGRDDFGLYNGAVLMEPSGRMRRYLKAHLPWLGLDRFVTPGDALPVFQTELGAIGILVCFDLRPPEAARTLALSGAELIVLPTNWPVGAEVSAGFVAPTRAAENKVFLASCNRVGEEKGFRFIGQSGIYGVGGKALAKAEGESALITAELDLSQARNKHTVNIPGEYELEIFRSRRPDLYLPLTEPLA
ncbi:MAG: carbon-nitrogen hydrolase family protein [Fimbriimonadaceae bacterium]|jgi:predicted amidohydrolase|nr:carbon-nitrogen hydrolase family protein [Fimbriimonadaceae bacterium]